MIVAGRNIVRELYRASQAGVQIDLWCAHLRIAAGVRGVSDHIKVRSIVGRFLEHSRIFYFANGGEEKFMLVALTGCRATCWNAWRRCFPLKIQC